MNISFCPVCQSHRIKRIWIEGNFKVFYCLNCRVNFLLSPNEIRIEGVYNQSYYEKYYFHFAEKRRDYFRFQIKDIERFLKVSRPRLLDIGCGIGLFLKEAKERGWEVYGQERSNFAANYCQSVGLPIFYGKIEEIPFPSEYFDIITLWDVLAHLEEPAKTLEKVHLLLKEKGLLIIKTPNHPLIFFKIFRLLSPFLKNKGFFHIPAQIFHFSPVSLKNLLRHGSGQSCLTLSRASSATTIHGFTVLSLKLVNEPFLTLRVSTHFFKNLFGISIRLLLRTIGFKESIILYSQK